jgi:hypothetical protein
MIRITKPIKWGDREFQISLLNPGFTAFVPAPQASSQFWMPRPF